MTVRLRAPFPWFGGKSRAAHLVWQAFGPDVPNYVEPFAGSLAVLLGRPADPRIETVNDLDCYLANFWRSLQVDPEGVATAADWPVNEADLHARHLWLVQQQAFRDRMRTDPAFFDSKVAGWWVWGICQWIGGGWCTVPKPGVQVESKRPKLGEGGSGPHAKMPRMDRGNLSRLQPPEKMPLIGGTRGTGVHRRTLNNDGGFGVRSPQGVNKVSLFAGAPKGVHARGVAVHSHQRPHLSDNGRGVLSQQLPCISGDSGASGRGVHASAARDIFTWMAELAARLRHVRVCCGDWRRILGPSPTTCIGVTGVFLDPPYSRDSGRDPTLYAAEDLDVAHQVREWALANGDNPKLRIALCGYEGEHQMPPTWACVAWEAAGGYGPKSNSVRERIWFSPHCLTARHQLSLPLGMEASHA